MVRISATFIAVCMVLIAASLGAVLYLRFGFTGAESALVALGTLAALAVYNAVTTRMRNRAEAGNQISMLSRGFADLARQVAEFGRRLNDMDKKVEQVLERSLATAQPLAAELEELSTLVKYLADSVAAHDLALSATAGRLAVPVAMPDASATPAPGIAAAVPASVAATANSTSPAASPATAAAFTPAMAAVPAVAAVAAVRPERGIPAFSGLDRDGIISLIRAAIDGGRIDLFLQPIVTLPQRKVQYYEAMSRLRADNGEHVAAADFLKYAEAGTLMPKLDHLALLRCVQVVRRLMLKNRDIGLFCNLSGATLSDSTFPSLLDFIEANRAIAPALVFEFTQSAVRAMGPIEHESLAAMAERGFRFSMDHLADLRVEPRELTDRGFRFIKVPAPLLLNRVGAASTDIHPADLSDLLGRFGIDLVAERIESESTVVDLLDYDVRFGQGYLFAPPRPVRAEALQAAAGKDLGKSEAAGAGKNDSPPANSAGPANQPAGARGTLAQLLRATSARA
ncbi:MAG: EAL domain-containing protein [Xanthobacteraceae bacterium]